MTTKSEIVRLNMILDGLRHQVLKIQGGHFANVRFRPPLNDELDDTWSNLIRQEQEYYRALPDPRDIATEAARNYVAECEGFAAYVKPLKTVWATARKPSTDPSVGRVLKKRTIRIARETGVKEKLFELWALHRSLLASDMECLRSTGGPYLRFSTKAEFHPAPPRERYRDECLEFLRDYIAGIEAIRDEKLEEVA